MKLGFWGRSGKGDALVHRDYPWGRLRVPCWGVTNCPTWPISPPTKWRLHAKAGKAEVGGEARHAGADGQTDVVTLYCMEPCKHRRRDAADMVRCCICYNWFHEDCLGRDCAPSHDATWWLCRCCRQMPQTISTLTTSVNRRCGLVETLSAENKTLKDEISVLKNSNDVTSAQTQSLKDIDLGSRSANYINGQNKLPRLLIGDSTIRGVLSVLCVNSKGGAKTGDILSMLKKYKPGSHSDVLVHVGTNDSSTKFPNDKICLASWTQQMRNRSMGMWSLVVYAHGPTTLALRRKAQW